MSLNLLADCIEDFLTSDFKDSDRRDIREYAIYQLHKQGLADGGVLASLTLPEILTACYGLLDQAA